MTSNWKPVHLAAGRWARAAVVGAAAVGIVVALAACGGGASPVAAPTTAPAKPAATTAPAAAAATAGSTAPAATSAPAAPKITGAKQLTGAGATFPFPLYSKWFDVYKQSAGVEVNYQSVGSGAGIKQLTENTVDFGASDAVMSEDQIKQAGGSDVFHIPTAIGAVVATYNVTGIESGLKLTPETISGIYLGTITKWNDPKIAADNPDRKLPDTAIAVVARSDGSGTTSIFTDYLSAISPDWKAKVGKGTSVKWPVGLGAKGNEGVAGQVKQTPGAIGYVELAYAEQNKLPYASMKNQAGKFVAPTIDSTTAAAAGAASTMPDNLRVSLVNAPGDASYPIAGFTWLLVRKDQSDASKGKALVDLVWWGIHDGQKYHKDLLYAPLPADVVKKAEAMIKQITFQGKPLYQ